MSDELDELVVRVRADTGALRSEMDAIKRDVEGPLSNGLSMVGRRLETVLSRAVRRGRLDLDDLKRAAMSAMNSIVAASFRAMMPSAGGMGGFDLTKVLGSFLGLPGRATGGPVSSGRPYLVGENGPEVFMPERGGRVERLSAGGAPVSVSISLRAPVGEHEAPILSRSSRQVAAAVARAVRNAR